MVVAMILMGLVLAHIAIKPRRPSPSHWHDLGIACRDVALDHPLLVDEIGRDHWLRRPYRLLLSTGQEDYVGKVLTMQDYRVHPVVS